MSALAYATREKKILRAAEDDPRMAAMPVADFFTRIDRDPEAYARVQRFAKAFGQVNSPAKVWQLAGPLMEREDSEAIWTLNLDVHGLFKGIYPAHRGSIDRVEASLPHVLRAAVMDEANFYLLHNHPSGDASPSREDARLTRAALEAVKKLPPLRMFDHLICGMRQMYSFKWDYLWHF